MRGDRATQWRLTPTGRLAGLDYPGGAAVARGLGEHWKAVFEPLCVIEGAVLETQEERG